MGSNGLYHSIEISITQFSNLKLWIIMESLKSHLIMFAIFNATFGTLSRKLQTINNHKHKSKEWHGNNARCNGPF